MHFYVLDAFPRGPADTCAEKGKGYNFGDASLCPKCGACIGMLTWLPPFRVVLKLYGTEFGDFAFLGASDEVLVSQRFKEIYEGTGLTGLPAFDPVEILKVKSRRRKRPNPPAYFRVAVPYSRTAIDLTASEFEWLEPPTCSYCHTANIVRWKRLIVEEGTWTGEDIFRPRGMPGEFVVSERFKDTCDTHHLTNAVFHPAESYGRDFYPWLKDPSDLNRLPQ